MTDSDESDAGTEMLDELLQDIEGEASGSSDEILLAIIMAAANEEEPFDRDTVITICETLGGKELIDTAKQLNQEAPDGLDAYAELEDPEVDELLAELEDEE